MNLRGFLHITDPNLTPFGITMAESGLFVPKQHCRSQSEIVGKEAKRESKKLTQTNMLRTTSVNCLFNAIGQDSFLSSPKGRPRSWTWHGYDNESIEDKGVFSLEEDLNQVTASLNAYNSEEDILDADNNVLPNDHKLEKQAIKDIISDVLVTEFLNGHYDESVAIEQCALVSQRIQAAVRGMLDKEKEVKVVATVHTGEQKGQAVEVSCQCLWDPEKDNLVTVSFQDQSLFAICTVFIVHT